MTWSPDGKSVAIGAGLAREQPDGVLLVSSEEREKRKLTLPPTGSWDDTDPAFSSDGRTLAFVRWSRNDVSDIYLQNANAAETTRLTFDEGQTYGLAWTPDGRSIAFDSTPGGQTDAFVVSPEGGAPRRITPPTTDAFVPSWSHDGKWVYFCWNRNGDFDIWKMPADGGAAVQVTKTGGFEVRESKGGKWIYFSRPPSSLVGGSEKSAIRRMPVEGGTETF